MSNISLDAYDRFFDAQAELPTNKSLPDLIDGNPQSSDIYRLPLDDRQAPASKPLYKVSSQILDYDFDEHHSARYYPHTHQTLKTSHKPKRDRKRENRKREKKGSRPSHQFFPSLRQVSEQSDTSSQSSSDILWFKSSADREVSQGSDGETSPITKQPRSSGTHASTAPAEVSHTDTTDNILVIPSDTSQPNSPLLSVEMPAASASDTSLTSSDNKEVGVKFTVGGDKGSENMLTSDTQCLDMVSDASQSEPVKFTVGASYSNTSFTPADQNNSSGIPQQSSISRGRSHTSEDLSTRRRPGSEVELSTITRALHKVPSITTPDEAALLNSLDLEDLASHRLENVRGIRRHKIKRKTNSKMDAKQTNFNESLKLAADHTPHELFIELDELVVRTHDNDSTELWEWKEKARWIKFEEDVLDSAGRWGQPHVPSLSFHSLIELRRLLENGLVALDLDVHNYLNMMEQIVDRMILSGQLKTESKDYVMNALLLRHSHLDGRTNFLRSRSYGNLKGLESLSRHKRSQPGQVTNNNHSDQVELGAISSEQVTFRTAEEGEGLLARATQDSFYSSKSHIPEERYNVELLRKIPAGSETVTVLVGTLKGLTRPATALVRLYEGLPLDHIAEVPLPVRFVFLCIGPSDQGLEYVEIGRSMSTLMSNPTFRDAVYGARDRQTILTAMNGFLDDSIVLPPGEFDRKTLLPIMYMAKQKLDKKKRAERQRKEQLLSHSRAEEDNDDPLKRTGRPFGGLVKDVKRRFPKYLSDFRDGVNVQVLAAFIFIYFACLSPAITFGGLLSDKTEKLMGASEMLLATTIAGITFSLLSGQPLLITGFTGPLIVFEEGMFQFAKANGIDFLAWRLWVGCWIFIISIILVCVEASFLIRFVSRFTQEIFAFLISLIFIYEVFYKLVKVFVNHPLYDNYDDGLQALLNNTYTTLTPDLSSNITNPTNATTFSNVTYASITSSYTVTSTQQPDLEVLKRQPNTALLTMSLTLFTFTIAYYLKGIRNKKVLGRTLRRALGDFGVPIAILVMCVIDLLIGDNVHTQKLLLPSTFSVTLPDQRGWLINPLGNTTPLPIGHFFSAALPALLGSILIFMETLIAGMIVNKNENRLSKGTGFHLDVLLLGVLAMVNGFFGLPFVCCATVRSVAHTSALTVMSKNNAPGEKPKITGVLEQRVSNLLVHILIGASMFLGVVLSYIPVAVLFGVFLYMGVASLGGIQLYQRIVLLITPTKHHPLDVCFVRHVRVLKMHIFTLIQVICCGVLWAVKVSPGSLAFPFVLILLVPFRLFLLPKIFSKQELGELDKAGSSEVLAVADTSDEPDFYEAAHMPD